MAILEINTPRINPKASEATNGRFFYDIPIPEFDMEQSGTGIASQRAPAIEAIRTLGRIDQARVVKETNASVPGLVPPAVVEEAGYELLDQGAVWRRQTDDISSALAQMYPNQTLSGTIFDTESHVFLSDTHKIYKVDADLNVWAFGSLMSQSEMNAGVQIATEEMWHELLFRLAVNLD